MAADDQTPAEPLPAQSKTLMPGVRNDVTRVGMEREISGDLYHRVLVMPWTRFFLLLAAAYFSLNAVFALGYLACGEGALINARPGSFSDTFYFSIHTMATIGYGSISPASAGANVIVAIEAFVGLVLTAVATGLVFAKFARPSAKILFTEVATIHQRDGVPHLALRVANRRNSRIVDAQFKMLLQRDEVTTEGDRIRRFRDMRLVNGNSPFLYLSWTLLHRIDADSPLFGETAASLRAVNTEILVMVMGQDEVFAQTIHARHSYVAADLRFGHKFVDMLVRDPGGSMTVDYTHFHETTPQTPPASDPGAGV